MAEIRMIGGRSAIVDDGDVGVVASRNWHANWGGTGSGPYAVDKDGLPMSRLLLGLGRNDPRVAEHRNGNTLDNRRSNLRIATHTENMRNRKAWGAVRYKGVTEDTSRGVVPSYRATIRVGGVCKKRRFGSPEEAARQYDEWAREAFGEFACVNFPNPGETPALR